MKTCRALIPTSRILLAWLCALPLLLLACANSTRAQQSPVTHTDTTQAQGTQSPAPSPQINAPSDTRVADSARKKAPVALGSINGRVVGEGGEPLAGVWVTLFSRTFGPSAPHTTTTDDAGNFKVIGLEPGVYAVSASMPGYISEADPLTGRTGGAYRPGDTATVQLVKGGVVTGTVTDMQGEPLVAAGVRAHRVRDLDGRPMPPNYGYAGDDSTDDRGIYRIYGLQPGIYVVTAGGATRRVSPVGSAYDLDAPTFYPSATRDTALEITVRAGQEVAGIDVRHRDDQGHRITGRVEIPAIALDPNVSVGIALNFASTGINAGSTWVPLNSENRSFSLEAIADGDYDIQASGGGRQGPMFVSAPQRITVRGADVTGLALKLLPIATVSGTLSFEPTSDADRARDACKNQRASLLPQETLVTLLVDRAAASKGQPSLRSLLRDATPDDVGAFAFRNLEAGRYRLSARPLDENLFVRAIQLPGATVAAPAAPRASAASAGQRPAAASPASAATQASTATRDALDIKPGQQLSGVAIKLAEGAALLSGRVAPAEGAAPPPFAQLRVYLLPAERERADDALRFFETRLAPDGSFNFKNLPPGRYLALARPSADMNEATPRSASWDADARARLRREAEASGAPIELQPCQRAADFNLRFPPPTK